MVVVAGVGAGEGYDAESGESQPVADGGVGVVEIYNFTLLLSDDLTIPQKTDGGEDRVDVAFGNPVVVVSDDEITLDGVAIVGDAVVGEVHFICHLRAQEAGVRVYTLFLVPPSEEVFDVRLHAKPVALVSKGGFDRLGLEFAASRVYRGLNVGRARFGSEPSLRIFIFDEVVDVIPVFPEQIDFSSCVNSAWFFSIVFLEHFDASLNSNLFGVRGDAVPRLLGRVHIHVLAVNYHAYPAGTSYYIAANVMGGAYSKAADPLVLLGSLVVLSFGRINGSHLVFSKIFAAGICTLVFMSTIARVLLEIRTTLTP